MKGLLILIFSSSLKNSIEISFSPLPYKTSCLCSLDKSFQAISKDMPLDVDKPFKA